MLQILRNQFIDAFLIRIPALANILFIGTSIVILILQVIKWAVNRPLQETIVISNSIFLVQDSNQKSLW